MASAELQSGHGDKASPFPQGQKQVLCQGTARPAKLQSLSPCPPRRPAICLGSQVGVICTGALWGPGHAGAAGPGKDGPSRTCVRVVCVSACDPGPARAPLETAAVPWPQVRHLECGQPGGRTNDRRRGRVPLQAALGWLQPHKYRQAPRAGVTEAAAHHGALGATRLGPRLLLGSRECGEGKREPSQGVGQGREPPLTSTKPDLEPGDRTQQGEDRVTGRT